MSGHEASIVLPPSAATPARARRFAGEVLASAALSCDGLDLVISELVTNAVRHTSTEIELTIIVGENSVRAQVRDDSPDAPRRRQAANSHRSGRGLAIIEAIAGGWSVTWHGDGTKTVAATLPCTPTIGRGSLDGRP